jgi:hypothetical protein
VRAAFGVWCDGRTVRKSAERRRGGTAVVKCAVDVRT